ncbi:MAG: B12-binding domain-containing radical SAM protein [Thermodesulfobacteriota bacterium]
MKKGPDLLLLSPAPLFRVVPLGIMSIASFIRSKGFTVEILADSPWGIKRKLSKRALQRTVVGITATTDVVEASIELCAWIKNTISPDIYCVIGGIHATALPQETLLESAFDCLVQGEGEITILEILEHFLAGKARPHGICGTWERGKNGEILTAPARDLIPDLDKLPFPAFDMVDFNLLKGGIRTGGVHCKRVATVLTSRGCPYQCVFCGSKSMWHRKLRFHSSQYCLEFMEALIKEFRLDGFSFLDDELVAHKKRILELCSEITRRGLHKNIKWEAHSSATSANEEVFRAMKDAGCVNIRIGLESGSDKILKFLKKGQATVEKNYRAVTLAKKAGLHVFGSFIIGSPDETIDDVIDTINFIKDSGLTSCAVFVAVPYPGTELYDICRQKGYFRSGLSYRDYVVEGPNVSSIIRNEAFSFEQLDAIKRLINIHVVEPLNNNLKVESLNYRKEIEHIKMGDFARTYYSPTRKVINSGIKFINRLTKAIKDPNMVIYYFSRRR